MMADVITFLSALGILAGVQWVILAGIAFSLIMYVWRRL